MASVDLKKLAQMLNLSVSTISKALRDSYDISIETKKRVQELAEALNYHPNLHASSLRKNKSRTIAVILPEVSNYFFAEVINGIEQVAQNKGYHVLVYLTHEDACKEAALVKHLLNGRVDGILICLSLTTRDISHLREFQAKGFPLVLFDRVIEHLNTAYITTDNYDSAYKATSHLIQQGSRRIAHIMVSDHLLNGRHRLQGYRQALSDLQEDAEELVVQVQHNDDKDYELLRHLLSGPEAPDGIFSAVEKYALLCYKVCKDLGLSIPGKVKVICFSNLHMAAFLNPSLSTIRQPAFDMGREAASILVKALEKKNFNLKHEHIVLPSHLIARESTAAFKKLKHKTRK